MRRHSTLSSLLALVGGLFGASSTEPVWFLAPPTPRPVRGTRGQASRNYAARARRSHAGKPVGYVKAY